MTPEEQAREKIDALLSAAGWVLQDKAALDRSAGGCRGARVLPAQCGLRLPAFCRWESAGVIEAKPAGQNLGGVEVQSTKYMVKLPDHLARWPDQLIVHYESTGDETYFRDILPFLSKPSISSSPTDATDLSTAFGGKCWNIAEECFSVAFYSLYSLGGRDRK